MWLIYLTADPHLCTSSSLKLWTCFGLECWKTTRRIGEEFTRYSALLILHHIFTFKWDITAEMKCTLHTQCLVKSHWPCLYISLLLIFIHFFTQSNVWFEMCFKILNSPVYSCSCVCFWNIPNNAVFHVCRPYYY